LDSNVFAERQQRHTIIGSAIAEREETGAIAQKLGDELLRLHHESYGRGTRPVRVHYLQDTVICLLDDLELLPNEEFLLDAGEGNAVVEVRAR
jgi:uncharacterized protein YbcI